MSGDFTQRDDASSGDRAACGHRERERLVADLLVERAGAADRAANEAEIEGVRRRG
jgi:hypothetical protein